MRFNLGHTDQAAQQVDVVGHDNEVAQMIILTVAGMQALGDDLRELRMPQEALAVATIEVIHELPSKFGVEFRFQVRKLAELSFPIRLVPVDSVTALPIVAAGVPRSNRACGTESAVRNVMKYVAPG